MTRRPHLWALAALLFAALAICSVYLWDARVVEWVHRTGLDAATKKWNWVRKRGAPLWPGHFLCTLVIAALLAIFHRSGLRGACMLILAGILTGTNSIIKWAVGRNRPDWKTGTPSFTLHPFQGGLHGLFSQENLAFPSGDVALAVATAAALSYLLPRWSIAWWLMAAVVAFQRIAESSHHLSDVFAAAALGIVAFHCARLACRLSPDSKGDPQAVSELPPPS